MSKPAEAQELPVLNLDTLMGDLRDALLQRLRAMPKPWTVMSQSEQSEMIFGCENAARHLVTQAVKLIAANGHEALPAVLEQVTVKDGMKIQLKASRHDPLRHECMDHLGAAVMIVLVDQATFMGQKAEAKPDPDQRELPGTNKPAGDNVSPLKPH